MAATDIAARGIDVEDLSLVVNYDLPNVSETYVHRIGRTGRANASGTALSFCDKEERPYLRDIEKLIKQSVPRMPEHQFVDEDTPQDTGSQPAQQQLVVTTLEVRIIGIRADLKNEQILAEANSFC